MPPLRSRRSGRFRLALTLIVVAAAAAVAWTARSLGHILHHEDPLERADAVFVLGGNWMERAAEAGHLYLEGYARTVVLSHEPEDTAVTALRAKGLAVKNLSDSQIDALVLMGVPRTAIEVLDGHVATADEAKAISATAVQRGWHTVIVVTHKLHTARARLVMTRRTQGTNVKIVMRATRYDESDLDHWWRDRGSLRFALLEVQKMLVYWIGIAD